MKSSNHLWRSLSVTALIGLSASFTLAPLPAARPAPKWTAYQAGSAPKVAATAKTTRGFSADSIPDNGSLSWDDLKQSADAGITRDLGWTSIKTLSRSGKHIVVDSTAGTASKSVFNFLDINVAAKVEFDFSASAGGATLTNLTGLSLKSGTLLELALNSGTVTAPVDSLGYSVDAQGNITSATIKGTANDGSPNKAPFELTYTPNANATNIKGVISQLGMVVPFNLTFTPTVKGNTHITGSFELMAIRIPVDSTIDSQGNPVP